MLIVKKKNITQVNLRKRGEDRFLSSPTLPSSNHSCKSLKPPWTHSACQSESDWLSINQSHTYARAINSITSLLLWAFPRRTLRRIPSRERTSGSGIENRWLLIMAGRSRFYYDLKRLAVWDWHGKESPVTTEKQLPSKSEDWYLRSSRWNFYVPLWVLHSLRW